MKLSINICARNRPHLLAQTVETTLANIALKTTTLMISVDDDDEATKTIAMQYLAQCAVAVRPREDTLGEKYNRVMTVAPADVYMNMVDYAPVVGKGFDEIVLDAASVYPDRFCAVIGPLANLSFPCFQAVTARLAAVMGGIFPPCFPFWFVDHWLDDIYKMIDRVVAVPVYTDFWSRRPMKTHELRDVPFWANFYDAAYPLRCDIANAVINHPDFAETVARKNALPRNFEIIRQRSAMINEVCRQNGPAMEAERGGTPPDERYLRVKRNAERVLLDLKQRQQEKQAKAA